MSEKKKYEVPETESGKLEESAAALRYGEAGTAFNPVQQHLLKMFAYDGSEERLKEVKKVLTKHFSDLVDERLNELWDSGELDQKKLDELRNIDLRKDTL